MKMRPDEITIAGCRDDTLFVLADLLAFAKNWPDTITYDGAHFRFEANEIMPDYAVGSYSGYAIYRKAY